MHGVSNTAAVNEEVGDAIVVSTPSLPPMCASVLCNWDGVVRGGEEVITK